MGEFKDSRGIRCFSPDDTDTEFYIAGNFSAQSLRVILKLAREKWGDYIDINELLIEPEYIHTHALGYDCYDSSDYTRYLRIEYNPSLDGVTS